MAEHAAMRRLVGAVLLGAAAALAPSAAAQDPADYTVEFFGRTIDLRPYVQGFPYSGWSADYDAGRLFYLHNTPEGRFLLTQPPGDGMIAPEAGQRVHDIDWSRRNIQLEAGDPATERDRLLDRSPLSHVARLSAPLLLTHGANDSRVGV